MAFSEITVRRGLRPFEIQVAEGSKRLGIAQSIRYRAYLRANAVPPTIESRVVDRYDWHPFSRTYLLREGRRSIGTVRNSYGLITGPPELGKPTEGDQRTGRPDSRLYARSGGSVGLLPALDWFGAELRDALGVGARVIEATHLAIDPSEDDVFLDAHDRLLRLALVNARAHGADSVIVAIPRRHVVFYRRQWRMQRITTPRPAYGLRLELCLMALGTGAEGIDRLYAQRPWLIPNAEEIEALAIPSPAAREAARDAVRRRLGNGWRPELGSELASEIRSDAYAEAITYDGDGS